MTTARIIVKKMLQKAGIITKNESPSADEISDGLDALNDMVESWANDSLICTSYIRDSFPLGSANEYTIGSGQDFNTAWPISIAAAVIRWEGKDYPLSVIPEVMFEKYTTVKTAPGMPKFLTYDGAFPVGRIRIYPQPMQPYTLRLMSEKPLSAFTLDGQVILAPGWRRALIYNGAIEVAGEYGVDVSATVERIAAQSIAKIKQAVARNRSMDTNPVGPMSGGNIFSGFWS